MTLFSLKCGRMQNKTYCTVFKKNCPVSINKYFIRKFENTFLLLQRKIVKGHVKFKILKQILSPQNNLVKGKIIFFFILNFLVKKPLFPWCRIKKPLNTHWGVKTIWHNLPSAQFFFLKNHSTLRVLSVTLYREKMVGILYC